MNAFAELLKALAAIAWPAFAFYALWKFHPELRDLLARLRKGKVLGQEIELADSLSKLSAIASAAEAEAAAIPSPRKTESAAMSAADDDTIQRVLGLVATSPKAALLVLAAEIEREVRQILASTGLLRGRRHVPVEQAFAELDADGTLPKHVPSSLRLFWSIRNRLAHGHDTNTGDILSAIDSGIALLRALRAVPHEEHTVYHPGVVLYSDQSLRNELSGVRGLILEVRSPGGASTARRIYPTTRDDYRKGSRVAWEWSDAKTFGEAWYRDPDSGDARYAWTSSMEFVGRDIAKLE